MVATFTLPLLLPTDMNTSEIFISRMMSPSTIAIMPDNPIFSWQTDLKDKEVQTVRKFFRGIIHCRGLLSKPPLKF